MAVVRSGEVARSHHLHVKRSDILCIVDLINTLKEPVRYPGSCQILKFPLPNGNIVSQEMSLGYKCPQTRCWPQAFWLWILSRFIACRHANTDAKLSIVFKLNV